MAKRRFGPYTVETSNEDKILFPDDGITKGDLIDYYQTVAEIILPHLADRPLTMQRFPDGIGADGFYQKAIPDYFPDWIDRTRVHTADGPQDQAICSNRATLAYLAQLACVTLHPWLSRRDRPDWPDRLVIDLDPPTDDFEPVRAAAFAARDLFDELDLPAFVMTTGSRGLHVLVPLDRGLAFDEVRSFAQAFAAELARRHVDRLTAAQRKDRRGNRVYLDTSNIAYGQTTVCPYAVRARAGAPVAAPLDWSELADRETHARRWTLRTMTRRLGQRDDPWSNLARRARSLNAAREALGQMGD
ncbi:MAG: non-homologous end-joining DNA ligase [Planctomycetes bacterium]|nr:non-homologous end-joining DNA ligase [Planctomycetota bacterium]